MTPATEPNFTITIPKSTAEAAMNALAKLPWAEANTHIQLFMAQLSASAAATKATSPPSGQAD